MTEKTWFITGASRGFGREWAIAALERGDSVAATARDTSTLDDLAAKFGTAILPLRLDVTDREAAFAAVAKAQELTQKLEAAGLRTPEDPKVFVRTLGDDGGAVCDNPGESYGKALLHEQLTNGADFVGRRPVIVDRDILRGVALILETYCPDQLEHYQDAIKDLKTDDTVDL